MSYLTSQETAQQILEKPSKKTNCHLSTNQLGTLMAKLSKLAKHQIIKKKQGKLLQNWEANKLVITN